MIYALGVTSQSVDVGVYDDTGLEVTGLVAATFPTLKYDLAGPNADVSFPALSDLAALTTAYASGGLKERGNGIYRLDVPDGVFATAGRVSIRAGASGKHMLTVIIEVQVPVDTTRVGGVTQTAGDIIAAVSNIAVTGAALNAVAASAVYTTGSDTGGFANTTTLDGVFDSVADTAGTVDFYYQFSLGSTGQTAVGITWDGYVVGAVNTIKVYAYNWGGSNWEQIGTIIGIAGTVVQSQEWDLTSSHTGTGGNLGLVRIRFNATGLVTSTTKTDRILCGYTVVVVYPTNFASLAITAGGIAKADVQTWLAGTIPAPNVTGVPIIDVEYWDGVAIAEPATDGIPDINVKNWGNAVATGMPMPTYTQPVGFLAEDFSELDADVEAIQSGVAAIPTNPYTGTPPTVAQIATGVWQDTTAGDFTVASSIGKSLFTAGIVPGASGGLFIAGTNAATTVNITGNLVGTVTTVTNLTNLPSIPSNWLTAAGITAGALNGKGDWSTVTPTNLTAAQIATGVWQDATAGDFTAASSIGKSLYTAGVVPGAAGGLFIAGANAATTVNITGNITGTVTTVTTLTNLPSIPANWLTAVGIAAGALNGKGDWATVNPSNLTAAQIATGVWQDAVAGDFTAASSIGKSLFTAGLVPGAAGGLFIAGTNAATTVNITGSITGSVSGSVGSVTGAVGSVTGNVGGNIVGTVASVVGNVGGIAGTTQTLDALQTALNTTHGAGSWATATGFSTLTAAQAATAVWQDTTAGDFANAGSPGKILVTQLGGGFTTTSSSIYTAAALQNAPSGGSAPTAAQVATAVWQDVTAGDFSVLGSPGKIVVAQLGGTFTTQSSSVFSTAALANGPSGSGGGTGAFPVTVVVTSDGATPIIGATVRISGAQSGLLVSNGSGAALFSLDAGGVTLSISAPGYYYNATSQTISGGGSWVSSGTSTLTITMTANPVVAPSTDPALTNCYFTVRNTVNVKQAGVIFTFTLVDPLRGTDAWTTANAPTATSDVNGLITILLPISMGFVMMGPDGQRVTFTTGAGTTSALPEYIGRF